MAATFPKSPRQFSSARDSSTEAAATTAKLLYLCRYASESTTGLLEVVAKNPATRKKLKKLLREKKTLSDGRAASETFAGKRRGHGGGLHLLHDFVEADDELLTRANRRGLASAQSGGSRSANKKTATSFDALQVGRVLGQRSNGKAFVYNLTQRDRWLAHVPNLGEWADAERYTDEDEMEDVTVVNECGRVMQLSESQQKQVRLLLKKKEKEHAAVLDVVSTSKEMRNSSLPVHAAPEIVHRNLTKNSICAETIGIGGDPIEKVDSNVWRSSDLRSLQAGELIVGSEENLTIYSSGSLQSAFKSEGARWSKVPFAEGCPTSNETCEGCAEPLSEEKKCGDRLAFEEKHLRSAKEPSLCVTSKLAHKTLRNSRSSAGLESAEFRNCDDRGLYPPSHARFGQTQEYDKCRHSRVRHNTEVVPSALTGEVAAERVKANQRHQRITRIADYENDLSPPRRRSLKNILSSTETTVIAAPSIQHAAENFTTVTTAGEMTEQTLEGLHTSDLSRGCKGGKGVMRRHRTARDDFQANTLQAEYPKSFAEGDKFRTDNRALSDGLTSFSSSSKITQQPELPHIVYRDKEGRSISEAEWLALQDKICARWRNRQKRQREAPPKLAWGSGLLQRESQQQMAKEDAKVAQGPFARYEIEDDTDEALKQKEQWDDPLRLVPHSRSSVTNFKVSNSSADADFPQSLISSIKHTARPTCPFDAPRNRFGLRPGYRWDGVYRGNGYEDRRLQAMNKKKLSGRATHMKNVADM